MARILHQITLKSWQKTQGSNTLVPHTLVHHCELNYRNNIGRMQLYICVHGATNTECRSGNMALPRTMIEIQIDAALLQPLKHWFYEL